MLRNSETKDTREDRKNQNGKRKSQRQILRMGGTESCCGRGEKSNSSSVDRTRGDVEKRNKDRPIENVDIVTKVTKKASSKRKFDQ